MSETSIRPDGRKNNELRKLTVEVGVLDRPDGSARVRLGKNLAIAGVFGPREMHPKFLSKSDKAIVRVTYRMATFSVLDYKRSFPSRREKEISKVLSEAFEAVSLTKYFPRSSVDIHVQIFESDGGTRTAAAIAISAALADAGIPVRDLIGGIATGLYKDEVCLDLNGEEDMKGTGDMPILYAPEIDEVALFQLDGKFTLDQFKESFNTSLLAIKDIVNVIKDALRMKYIKVREEVGVVETGEEEQEEIKTYIQDEFISESATPEVIQVEEVKENITPNFPSDDISDFDPDDLPDKEETVATQTEPEIVEEVKSITPVQPVIEETESVEPAQPVIEEPESVTTEHPTIEEKGADDIAETKKEEEVDDADWYDKSLGLKSLNPIKKKDENDVMRDIEYSSTEEDE